MLRKEICLKCIKEVKAATCPSYYQDTKWFREGWSIKFCRCPYNERKKPNALEVWSIPIKDKPPENCPYILEQTVNQNVK